MAWSVQRRNLGWSFTGAALACVLLFLPPARAQQAPSGLLIGQVEVSGGAFPETRLFVELQVRGATLKSTYTDGEGRFSFTELLPNAYRIVINVPRYVPVNQLVVIRPDIFSTRTLVILEPLPTHQVEAPPPAGASGANPHLVSAEDFRRKYDKEAVQEFDAGVKDDEHGKPQNAIKHYRKAVEIAPEFYQAHNNLGSALLHENKLPAAESEFRQAIELNQADGNAYFNLGNVLYLTQRFEEAVTTLQEGLKREPQSALGQFLFGSALSRQGRLEEAEGALLRAMELDPQKPEVRLQLVNVYLMEQRKDDAIDQLRTFAKLFPRDPLLPQARAVLQKLEASTDTTP